MRKKVLARKICAAVLGLSMAAATVLSGFAGSVNVVRAEGVSDYEAVGVLKDVYADRFKVGVAVQAISHWGDQSAEIGNPSKEQFIASQFNSMTFGNEFKPAYNFDAESDSLFTVNRAAEELLDWAKENGVPVRGHTLVWHSQVDPSIFAKDFTATVSGKPTRDYNATLDEDCLVSRDELLNRLEKYINGVIEYTYANGYADVIYAWDVVNEAADESQADGMRKSYWYKIIGPDFLYYAFLYAREAETKYAAQYADLYGLDPEGDLSSITPGLYYNDYNEWFPKKCDAIIAFLTETQFNAGHTMVKSDVINPDGDGTIYGDGLIDGIGLQGHLTVSDSLYQYKDAIEKYSAAINNLQVTELDVGKAVAGEAGEFKQAKFYYDYFKMLCDCQDAGANINSVTLWGLTDTSSWRKESEPLLFYQDLTGKPAYEAVIMAGKGEEFTLTDTSGIGKAEDMVIDFEPVIVDGTSTPQVPDKLGFVSRGSGHQASIMLKIKENHTEGANPGFSLQVRRSEADATLRYDITRFIGHTIKISYYYKSSDTKLFMGVDGYEDGGVREYDIAGEDWQLIEATLKLPEDLDTAALFFETDGSGDFYIDDFSIALSDGSDAAEGFDGDGADETGAEASGNEDGQSETQDGESNGNHGAGTAAIVVLLLSSVALSRQNRKKEEAKEGSKDESKEDSGKDSKGKAEEESKDDSKDEAKEESKETSKK
ncbi:MAG: endo-1,4-beta-xylanase [Lachnospiraceae bacterium]|nr:endo-1,4-beta-xylanase [Lachnospiraceae bacterium]